MPVLDSNETAILLVGAVMLFAVFRIYRRRRQGGRHAQAAGHRLPRPEDYTTGVLIMAEQERENFLAHELPDWRQSHPRDASVAVAAYDDLGRVKLFLYESDEDPNLLWQGEIGTIPLTDLRITTPESATCHADIDDMVLPLVRETLGPVRMTLEQP